MMPIRDLNPTNRLPLLTWALIAANVLVFLWEISLPPDLLQSYFLDYSVVPVVLVQEGFTLGSVYDVFRSMFFHGGWAHLGGNMLYLFLFGDNLEDYLGKLLYLLVYFGSGIAAVFAQVAIDPTSGVPLVGASGAIAGVLGGYLVLYPNVRVQGLIFLGRIATVRELPAYVVLGFWFVLQLFNGIASLGASSDVGGGVAFFAHIGGFVFGAVVVFLLRGVLPGNRPQREGWAYARRR